MVKSRRLISLPPSLAIPLRERTEHVIAQRSALGLTFEETNLVFCQYDGSSRTPAPLATPSTALLVKLAFLR